jgi:hypothetical protein
MTGEPPPAWSLQARQPGQSALDMVNALRGSGAPEAEVRPWEIGLHGERMAARIFARLGDEWTVLHDVPVGTQGANIDHVLIGAAGVFTINTKHHPKADIIVSGPDVLVREQPQPYVEKALYEGKRASRLLSDCTGKHIPVQPILLFVGAASVTVHRSPMGVLISDSDSILGMLDSFSYSLTHATLDAVLAAAVHPETWAQSVVLPTPAPRQSARVAGTPVHQQTALEWHRYVNKSLVPPREKKPVPPHVQLAWIAAVIFLLLCVLAALSG